MRLTLAPVLNLQQSRKGAMTPKPVFLSLRGEPLTRDITLSLFALAQFMMIQERKTLNFETNDFGGEIETSFQRKCNGTSSGIVFRARVRTEKGTTEVDYLVEPSDTLNCVVLLSPDDYACERRIDPRTLN
jgi:hypothetical protein